MSVEPDLNCFVCQGFGKTTRFVSIPGKEGLHPVQVQCGCVGKLNYRTWPRPIAQGAGNRKMVTAGYWKKGTHG